MTIPARGHMSPHADTDLDADDVSITSTVEGQPDGDTVYAVDEILAEKWDVWDHDPDQPVFRGIKYLTKWEGYPLHDLVGTWEPESAFSVPDEDGNEPSGIPPVLQTWHRRKTSMGEAQFQRLCRKNIEDFHIAIETAETARAVRKAKRAEKRRKLAASEKRPSLFVADSDDEDELEAPGQSQKQIGQQRAIPHAIAVGNYNSSSIKQPRTVRRPPLVQSDSSSSEADLTDDSMMAELGKTSRETTRNSTSEKGKAIDDQPKRTATPLTLNQVPNATQTKQAINKEPQKPPQSLKNTVSQSVRPATVAHVTGGNQSLDKPADPAPQQADTASRVTKTRAVGTSSVEKPANLATQANINKATGNGGIKVVNQPKAPLRSEWTKGDKAFSTLHFRAIAQKRSRAEGTPDPAALEIVNELPGNSKPKVQAAHDNPYSRREIGQDRARSPDSDDFRRDVISENSTDGNVPLAPWEVGKVPQVCASWRLSNNCPKTAQTCSFLHRNNDPEGRDYPVGHIEGWIPPKYRKPPLTCTHWLYGKNGCYKPENQCSFAHRNTGWIPNEGHPSEKATQIDPSRLPQSQKTDGVPTGPKSNKRVLRRDLTCWYWVHETCRNTPENCPFQHYDTGILARPPPGRENDVFVDKVTQHVSINTVEPSKKSPLLTDKNMNDRTTTKITQSIQHRPPEATCEKVCTRISSVCELDFEDLFTSSDDKRGRKLMDRRAFLVYHSEQHAEELEVITRWLLMHHVQIYGVHFAGAWARFQQQIKSGGSGVIIVHPDFEYFTELSDLGDILRYQVRIWSVGLQESIEYDPALSNAPPVYRYAPIEIFPVGGIIYITDEVFSTEPQVALKIVKLYFDKIAMLKQRKGPPCPGRQVEDASLLWRLCVRPELMQYLMDDCEQHEAELDAGDADAQSRAQLYTLLAKTGYIEQDDASEPLSQVMDKFPILSERRIIAESEPVDYFRTVARSQEAANLNMIRYYAGLQVEMRRDYRHFFVVHTQPRAGYVQQWRQEIQTIGGVLSPKQCVEELQKDSKVSLFDFCERFMPKKEAEEKDRVHGGQRE